MSAIPPRSTSSVTAYPAQSEVPSNKSREQPGDRPSRSGASAYIDQTDYDAYKRAQSQSKQDESNQRDTTYPSHGKSTNQEQQYRQRYRAKYEPEDEEEQDEQYYDQQQQQQQRVYPSKTTSAPVYGGHISRSNTYHVPPNYQDPSRVSSAKQRNSSSGAYQVTSFVSNAITSCISITDLED